MLRSGTTLAAITAVFLLLACETREERSARENAELDTKMARRRKREAKEDARRQEVAESAARVPTGATAARPEPEPVIAPEQLQSSYSRMGAPERAAAMREACLTGRDAIRRKAIIDSAPASEGAELDRLAESTSAAYEARERARTEHARARELASRVCCCDGTVSPTCTTVHSGCCSRHGGVCGCR
jgi:hypothetical protein